jgi:hypothetical protein
MPVAPHLCTVLPSVTKIPLVKLRECTQAGQKIQRGAS